MWVIGTRHHLFPRSATRHESHSSKSRPSISANSTIASWSDRADTPHHLSYRMLPTEHAAGGGFSLALGALPGVGVTARGVQFQFRCLVHVPDLDRRSIRTQDYRVVTVLGTS